MRWSEDKLYGKSGAVSVGSSSYRIDKEIRASKLQREESLNALEKKFYEIDRQLDSLNEKDPSYIKLLEVRANLAQTLRKAKGSR